MSHDVYIINYSLKVIIRHVVSTLLPSIGSSQFEDMFLIHQLVTIYHMAPPSC